MAGSYPKKWLDPGVSYKITKGSSTTVGRTSTGGASLEVYEVANLKSEMFHGEHFADFAELKVEIEAYIDWYNSSRRQERLKGMTPMEYRCHTLAA
ncbi:integrase core domain-containing protein [Glutamicibacter sp. AOP5-A2-18]|uniref:integrase core domain-containing protein n=1 Tax=Glutamicibacter sp. AOP5-A2-18 TaxID=3457656 RepID=UPI0040331D09